MYISAVSTWDVTHAAIEKAYKRFQKDTNTFQLSIGCKGHSPYARLAYYRCSFVAFFSLFSLLDCQCPMLEALARDLHPFV